MHIETGSKHLSTAGTAVQFFTVPRPYLYWVEFKPRLGNTDHTYITTSSGATSTSGWEFRVFDSPQPYRIDAPPGETFRPTDFWMQSASTSAVIDWTAAFKD